MLKNRKNVNKIRNIVIVLIALIITLGIYIKVQAIDLGNGTLNPIYRPEWTKTSSSLDTINKTLSVVLEGTASKVQTIDGNVSIKYSSTIASTLVKEDITVYIDGTEAPEITKSLTTAKYFKSDGTVTTDMTQAVKVEHTLTLSGFEASRLGGKNFKEWSGNVSIKIGGRGENSDTYTENILTDKYGNQSMMEIDTTGTWLDIIYKDANSTTNINTSGIMFTDYIKPEFTYEYSTTNPDINTGNESVTVVFDVTDKYFDSTDLSTNTNGSLITVIVDEDENANTPITKVLTRIKDVYYDETAGITYVTPDATGTGTKVGERYQLVITGLDREDGFSYSGPMTLEFPAGIVSDKTGNTSGLTSITMGVNEPGGDQDDEIVVDVVDPIWKVENLDTVIDETTGNVSATMDLIGVDKYFKQSTLTVNDVQIKVGGIDDISLDSDGDGKADDSPDLVETLGTAQYIKQGTEGYETTTVDDPDVIGVKYSYSISGLKETDETFFEEREKYNTDPSTGRPYREYSGALTIVIPEGKLEDETGNVNNQFDIDIDTIDTIPPEVIKVSGTPNINATNVELSTYTVVFDIVDKYMDSSTITTTDLSKIHVYLDGEAADSITKEIKNIQTLTAEIDGDSRTVGYRYTLQLSGFENARTEINYDRLYTDWSGDLSIKIDANTAKDSKGTWNAETILYGNEIETEDKTKASHVDFIKPDATYKYLETDLDTTNKKFTMVFEITDKFYDEDIDITNLQMIMSAEEETGDGKDGIYNLMDIPVIRDNLSLQMEEIKNQVVVDVVNGTPVKEEKTIGKKYTLVINHLEQVQKIENNRYLDYSGSITITIPQNTVQDSSDNGNDVTTITSGINIPGGAVVDIELVDVVSPLWESEGFTTDIFAQTATMTLEGTDKYFYEHDDGTTTEDDGYGTLTLDEVNLIIDGTAATGTISEGVKTFINANGDVVGKFTIGEGNKLYEQRIVPTEYSDGDVDTGYTTETVQYGIRYPITFTDFPIDSHQVKIQLTQGSLIDQSGNKSDITEFLVYNTLKTATDTSGNWEDAATDGFLGNATIQRQNIDEIVFVSSLNGAPTIDGENCWDVSARRDNSILAWKTQTTEQAAKGVYTVNIGSNDKIYGNIDSKYLFSYIGYSTNCISTTTVTNLNLLDTRNVTDMSYMFQYFGHAKMDGLNLGTNFYTNNVTNMARMFRECGRNAMVNFDLGDNFNTGLVTDMSYMFYYSGYTLLESMDLSSGTSIENTTQFNTSLVEDMSYMFDGFGGNAMITFNLGNNFNTIKVKYMNYMFSRTGLQRLEVLDLGGKFDTSNVENMERMFGRCGQESLTSFNLGTKFNTSKVTNMKEMFYCFAPYGELTSLDLGDQFYTTAVTDMYRMFYLCGHNMMTTLDLGPAFTRIATTNTDIFTDAGKSGACVIYAPESIYNDRTHVKLNTDSTTTIEYTRGTINPVYKPEWEKVSTTVDVANKEITVEFKGYANETFTNGTYTGSYLSTMTNTITAGNDSSNLLLVKVDGEIAEEITQTVTEVSTTKDANDKITQVQYKIKLSGFKEATRQTAKDKNFLEWSGNIAIQPVKGTLTDIYGNKNMVSIDDSNGKWTDIEFRDTAQEGSTDKTVSGNWIDDSTTADVVELREENTAEVMFTDYIKPEYTYVYSETNPDIDGDPDNRVTIVFDVTDKYFDSTPLSTDTTGSLITVKVDEDLDANTAIRKTLSKKILNEDQTVGNITYKANGDIYYTVNGISKKVGERYQLVIDGLESSDGVGYSGPLTLLFAEGSEDADGNLLTGIRDKSGNLSDAMSITMGVNEPDDPDQDDEIIVDVVNPVWSYADSEIDRTNKQVNIYIIGSDKYYKENTLTKDNITVYVDGSTTTVDTDRDGEADANVTSITKNLTDITAEMQLEENAARLAELIAGAGLTDSMTADNNLTAVGVIYKLTLSTFGTISGETKVELPLGTLTDESNNVNTKTTIEVGNVTWTETGDNSTNPRYPAFRNDIVDFIKPVIKYTYSTTEGSENPDVNYTSKTVTVKFTVTDKYLLESDLIETTTDAEGNTILIPKNMSIIIGGETVYVNDGDSTTTDTRIVTARISESAIANGKEYTLIVSDIEQDPNNAFDYSGIMQVEIYANSIDDTSGNKNNVTTITLDTEIPTDIVDVVDPIIYYSSSTINRESGTVILNLKAEDKYLDSEVLTEKINDINIKIKDLDGATIVNNNTTISKAISKTTLSSGGYIYYNFQITLTGFDTDTTMEGKADDYVPIKGITSILIPEDMILDTSGNGNKPIEIPVGNPSDSTAFKNSLVDCVSPVWEYEISEIDRDRYDDGIDHDETGTVTLDVIVTDKFFEESYYTDVNKELELSDITVYVNNTPNTTITKEFAKNADETKFKEYLTRTLADGTTAPYGVRYRLILSDFGNNEGTVKIEIDDQVIKDTSYNGNATTPINVGNVSWVEDDEPLTEGVAGYPKYTAFRNNIVDFINPVITQGAVTLNRTDDEVYIKFTVTDTNFLESNIGTEDFTIYIDEMLVYGTGANADTDIYAQISDPTTVTDAEGRNIGYEYTLTLSQLELSNLIGTDIFLRHSGDIRVVIAEGQIEDTSGNKNIETELNTYADFVDPILYYHSKYTNWQERYALITVRATDRFYDYDASDLEPEDLTLYELNESGQWVDITSKFYDPDNEIENITISSRNNAYGEDFIIRLDDFEEEFTMRIDIKAQTVYDTSNNYNKVHNIDYRPIIVDLDNRKPYWKYISTDSTLTDFEDDSATATGTISFYVDGLDKFLDVENVIDPEISSLDNTKIKILLDQEDITDVDNITVTQLSIDNDYTLDGEEPDADGMRSISYRIDVTGLTEIGTYTLIIAEDTLIDDFGNTSAVTTISCSKSTIASNTTNHVMVTYHITPDHENVHHSYVRELMSVNTSGTNAGSTTYRPSSLGELNNNGENSLFAEPVNNKVVNGYDVSTVYKPKSFAGWAEADEDGNIITGGNTYGLYDEIPSSVTNLKAVWQEAKIVYVSNLTGDDADDGTIPDNAVKTLTAAFNLLSATGRTAENNIIIIMDAVEWTSTTTITKPATITSLYAGIDYETSNNAEMKISANMSTNADIIFDNIKLYTDTNMLIANYANITLGRRITTPSDKYTFAKVIGGNYNTETTTGTIGTHTVRVESGRYNDIIAGSSLAAATTTTKTVTHEVVIGNMKDAALAVNDKLTITGYVTMGELTGATNTYSENYSNVTLYSGTIAGNATAAIYMRSVGGTVDGKTQFTMYGGEVNGDIYAGSRSTNNSPNVIVNTMKFYGGKVVGDVYGQGLNDTFTGTSDITLAGIINIEGNVFGGSHVTTAGKGNGSGNTNIRVETASATVTEGIYGGSNGLDNSGYLTGTTNITVNTGTLKNIYGSGKNAGNSENTNIIINSGSISGNVVGGAYNGQTGTTANITITGGIISGDIIGGNQNTAQTQLDNDNTAQDVNITINGTATINGTIYGSGTFDKVGTITIQLKSATNAIGAVYGGSNANAIIEETNITLDGMTVNAIYGGGKQAGTVTESNIILKQGTVTTDVYGGGDNAGDVTTSNISLEGATVTETIYGGSKTTGTVEETNITLTSGNITDVYGGGNSADVGTANVTLNGVNINEIHGGSKTAGTTTTTKVILTTGTVGTVFGGGLDSTVGESNITHESNATVDTIYGGNDSDTGSGGSVGTANINITDSTVANIYGGNYLKGTTTTTNINISGEDSNITGKLYGGGYKSNIGTVDTEGTTTINIAGGTIEGDINGGSEQAVVYGNTNINIGKDAVGDGSVTVDEIEIKGNIYGAGDSELAPNRDTAKITENYNYDFESVTGKTTIKLDNSIESPITFSQSIFGAGNGATYKIDPNSTDNSKVYIKDFGSSETAHKLISVERTGKVFIGNSFIELQGRADINNRYEKTSYTFNRITDGITIHTNTTIYTHRGFNKVGGFNSYVSVSEISSTGTKATMANVDNRIYTLEGVNLILSKEEGPSLTSTNFGEVNGMTFFGMFAIDRDTGAKQVDIYDPDYTGGAVEGFFANGTYIEGLHETSHNVNVDGFYTNVATYGESITVETQVIQPTPASATYYDWIIGAETVTYDISLIGSIYGYETTAELLLDHNYQPGATYTLDRVSINALDDTTVNLVNPLTIPMISANANNTFGLTMETDKNGWLNSGKTSIYTAEDVNDETINDGSFVGDLTYKSDTSSTPGKIKFKLYNSINISQTKDLGYVNLILTGKTTTGSDPAVGNTFIIVIHVNLQTEAVEQREAYVPTFTDTAMTNLHYTTDSRIDLTYLLFKEMEETPYDSNDYRVLSTTTKLPEGTKLTLKDYAQGNSPVVYYYHVTSSTPYQQETIGEKTRYLYRLSNFFEMDNITAKYVDSTSYFHTEGYVLEKYDLSIDFIDANLTADRLTQETYLELRNSESANNPIYDNDGDVITYNLHYSTLDEDEETISAKAEMKVSVDNSGQSYSVIDNTNITFRLDASITEQLTPDGDRIRDTKYYDKVAGIVIEVLDQNGNRVQLPNAQNVKVIDLSDSSEHIADESGVIRIPLINGTGSITKNYKFSIAQNSVPPGECSINVYFFSSDNGRYHGGEEKVVDQFYAIFVSKLLGLVGIEATEDSRIISLETGKNLEGNTGLDMTVNIGDAMDETNIRIELYKRGATYDSNGNYTGTQYTLVDITQYLEGTWETPGANGLTAANANEYILWMASDDNGTIDEEEQAELDAAAEAFGVTDLDRVQITNELSDAVTTGEYKIVLKSYYEDTLVQTVRKTFIVTE